MTDLVIPSSLTQARSRIRYLDSTGLVRAPYTGYPQTTNYGGDRIAASVEFPPLGGRQAAEQSKRAQLQAFIAMMRGKTNRVYLTDDSYTRRGAFAASELFTNSDFSNGTNGWSNSFVEFSVSDGVGRFKFGGNFAGAPQVYQGVATFTPYVPYVVRSLLAAGAGWPNVSIGPRFDSDSGLLVGQNLSAARGYLVASLVPGTSAGNAYAALASHAGTIVDDYLSIRFASASRCFYVDGGGNALLRSDEFDNASWTKTGATITANTTTAPDGTGTGDTIVDSSTTNHFIGQAVSVSASAADYAFSVSVAPGARSWVMVEMIENASGHSALVFVNVTTGAVGTITATGGNWTNVRAFVVDQGGTWRRITLAARKTNAATVITCYISIGEGDNDATFAATGGNALSLWRASMRGDSVPSRGSQTTTASAAIDAGDNGRSQIFVKGGRTPSEGALTGALLAGDWVEIDGQLRMVTAALDFNSAGLGVLEISPPLRRAIPDNTPIIIHKPLGRFMFAGDVSEWSNEPGVFTGASLEFEEA